jgi:hypothetical protein
MFLGEFSHSLDDKGRVTIPAKLRAGFADGLVITRGFEPCLVIYPVETFRVLEKKAHSLSLTNPSNQRSTAWGASSFRSICVRTPVCRIRSSWSERDSTSRFGTCRSGASNLPN